MMPPVPNNACSPRSVTVSQVIGARVRGPIRSCRRVRGAGGEGAPGALTGGRLDVGGVDGGEPPGAGTGAAGGEPAPVTGGPGPVGGGPAAGGVPSSAGAAPRMGGDRAGITGALPSRGTGAEVRCCAAGAAFAGGAVGFGPGVAI